MNTIFDFIAKIIDSIVWPVVVLILTIILRKEIGKLLLSIQKIRYKDFEAHFAKRTEELEKRAERLKPPAEIEKLPPVEMKSPEDGLEEVLRISPRLAVLESFSYVEDAIRKAATQHGIPDDMISGVRNKMRELEKMGLVSYGINSLFNDLRVTRNELTHAREPEISVRDAKKYIDVALLLTKLISNI